MALRQFGVCIVCALVAVGCSGNGPASDSSVDTSGEAADGGANLQMPAADGLEMPSGQSEIPADFEWPEAPDQLATIGGHWSVEGGDIYFSSEEKKDDIGFSYLPGVFVPTGGEAIEFRWSTMSSGFGELQEGVDHYFETMIGVSADVALPFLREEGVSTNVRFVPGKYTQGVLWDYVSDGSLDTKEVPITRIDDKQAP